jgi:hypothetical protein
MSANLYELRNKRRLDGRLERWLILVKSAEAPGLKSSKVQME